MGIILAPTSQGLFRCWGLKSHSTWSALHGAWHMAVRWLQCIEWMNASALCSNRPHPTDPCGKCAVPMEAGQRRFNDWAAQWPLIAFWNHRHSFSVLDGSQTTRIREGWCLSEALSIKPLKIITQTFCISTECRATYLADLKKGFFVCQCFYSLVVNILLKRGGSRVQLPGSHSSSFTYRLGNLHNLMELTYHICTMGELSICLLEGCERTRWDSSCTAFSSVPDMHGLKELELLPLSVGEALVSGYESAKSQRISFINLLTIFPKE